MSITSHLVATFDRLVRWPAPVLHADPGVLDRWLWLKHRLPRASGDRALLDAGCGSGAFTIGAALRGYNSLGISWDGRNQQVAAKRAEVCRADRARFQVLDLR